MPIRSENRDRYPPDWPEVSAAIRKRAGNVCEGCGVANGALGGRDGSGRWWKARPKGESMARLDWPEPGEHWWCDLDGREPLLLRIVRIVLTVAHLDHTPENCDPANLRCWCQRCHNLYDAATRRAGIQDRERKRAALGDLFAGGAGG
ncbi:MAG: hypothetical protein IH626_01735 [Rhodospirillales bacterium]|nr:hypothetical protein [Rhodospirillales bacterium]